MSEAIKRVAKAMVLESRKRNLRPLADDEVKHLARAAIEAMRLTSKDWPGLIRYSDDIDVFNDTLDVMLGKTE